MTTSISVSHILLALSAKQVKNKKIGSRENHVLAVGSDVTLQEFADSSKKVNGCRLRKGFTSIHSVKSQVKSGSETVNNSQDDSEGLNWYDKDLDDFGLDKATGCDEQSSDEDLESVVVLPKSKKFSTSQNDMNNNLHHVYPMDLWLVLSQYVHPEDIGRFAGICRYSNMAVHTVQFWKHIYHMYCLHGVSSLPEELQPCVVERIHGLRQRVIRALFYVYPPLVDRIKTTIPFENEPYHLVGHRCILHWHEKIKNKWVFNFKFKRETISAEKNYLSERKRHYDLFRGHNDLFYNPINNCCMLQVVCQNFVNIPPILGLTLNQIYLKVGHGMRYHCLKLVFNSSINIGSQSGSRYGSSGDAVVSIDPAVNLKVFPWWHSNFPVN